MSRSLADELREWDDKALTGLLVARPDLVTPVPADLSELATRAGGRASVARAVEGLDRFTLQVVDGLVHLPEPADSAGLRGLLGISDDLLVPVLDRIRGLALLWGPPDEMRLVRALREAVGAPAGLGPPASVALAAYPPERVHQVVADAGLGPTDPASAAAALAGLFADHDRMETLLAGANDPTRRLLDELAWGASVRRVDGVRGEARATDARSAVEWLVARGLLVVTRPDTVVVPREVGVHLRGGRLHAALEADPPPLETVARDPGLVDRTAAGAAFTAVQAVEKLLEAWAVNGPPVLRAGGIGVRDLRRAASAQDVSEHTLALLAEVAYTAGLLAPSDDLDQVWAPTPAYDAWLRRPTPRRWVLLASTWLETTRVPGLVGERDEKDKPFQALGRDLDHGIAPEVRSAVLRSLDDLPAGTAASAESVEDLLRWRRPRRGGRLRDRLVGWTLGEAETLGLLGRGALASTARRLLDGAGDDEAAADVLAALLPEPVDHVLLQADLTAVAPGPLTPDLARELALAADVESTGGATVYRFTESSVRRALDAGRSAVDLHTLLEQHSRTSVPQPLTYLVDDVSRRHGHVRVGAAAAFVRCDDEAVLSEILADRRAAQLRLHRLAPTVLAAQAPVDVLLDRLRAMGLSPVAETTAGDVVIARTDERRAPTRPRPPHRSQQTPTRAVLAAAVHALRAGDRAAAQPRRQSEANGEPHALPRTATAETLASLRSAVADGRPRWIGYVDDTGNASERIVDPVRIEDGRLDAYDHRTGRVRPFALHRITGVAVLDDSGTG